MFSLKLQCYIDLQCQPGPEQVMADMLLKATGALAEEACYQSNKAECFLVGISTISRTDYTDIMLNIRLARLTS